MNVDETTRKYRVYFGYRMLFFIPVFIFSISWTSMIYADEPEYAISLEKWVESELLLTSSASRIPSAEFAINMYVNPEDYFITTWRASNPQRRINIPTRGFGYNFTIDWGDGTVETIMNGPVNHVYAAPGIYTIKIIGDFPQIYIDFGPAGNKIVSIEHWGNIAWRSMRRAFAGAIFYDGRYGT